MSIYKLPIYVAAAVLACASFACAAADSYTVSAQLAYQGETWAKPNIIVRPDVPARVQQPGPDGYDLALTVSPLDGDKLKVTTRLQSAHGDMAPDLVVQPGQPATATVGPLGITVTVAASDK